jgi:hypothetical protein
MAATMMCERRMLLLTAIGGLVITGCSTKPLQLPSACGRLLLVQDDRYVLGKPTYSSRENGAPQTGVSKFSFDDPEWWRIASKPIGALDADLAAEPPVQLLFFIVPAGPADTPEEAIARFEEIVKRHGHAVIAAEPRRGTGER